MSVERVGVDVEDAGWGAVVDIVAVVAFVFITVITIAVGVIIGVGCKTDGCECNAKCGGFVDTA